MSCSAAPLICIPHFFYNADLLHKQAGTLSGKTGSGPRHAEILTRAASCDNVYRGKFGTIQFRDVPDMEYGGEPLSCHFDGEGFDLAGPHRLDAVAASGNPPIPSNRLPSVGIMPYPCSALELRFAPSQRAEPPA